MDKEEMILKVEDLIIFIILYEYESEKDPLAHSNDQIQSLTGNYQT